MSSGRMSQEEVSRKGLREGLRQEARQGDQELGQTEGLACRAEPNQEAHSGPSERNRDKGIRRGPREPAPPREKHGWSAKTSR